jgi:DNA polymerase-4
MRRIILHIDMDAFFASVEQLVNPALRGKPVVVCGANARTVVLTASYEARAFGVKTGMTLPEAMVLCPDLIVVEGRHERYTDINQRLLAIYQDYTPLVEVFSIDEAFLDLTGSLGLFGSAETIAKAVKHRIRRELGLTASVGIAPNKLLAKLASGLKKPDGLVLLEPEDIPLLLSNLPVDELCGIGPALTQKLSTLGITTCGELGRAPMELLMHHFGVLGRRLSDMGRGRDDSPVVAVEAEPDAKSIGHSMTLERDVSNRESLEIYLLQLSEMVGRRLRRAGLYGRTVALTLRYADFSTITRQRRQKQPIHDDLEIFQAAREIFRGLRLSQAVRLVGVTASDLSKDPGQLPLFEETLRRRRLTAAMDIINDRYGEWTVLWGTLLARDRHRPVISPAWRPKGTKHYC